MTTLSEALTEYLAMRRSLGFVVRLPASLLRSFVAFVDQAGSPFITTDLVRQWALQPTDAQHST
jgi:integrase/recombinase XerD